MNEILNNVALDDLIDRLAEKLPKEEKAAVTEEVSSLMSKRDTSGVWRQFAIWMLIDPEHGVIKFSEIGSDQYNTIQNVAQLYIDDCKDIEKFRSSCPSALAAGNSVIAAADHSSMFYFSGVRAAGYAAWAAGYAAGYAARNALKRFDDAAWAAAYNAYKAFLDAYLSESYLQTMADKLIELIKQAPEAT